MGDRLLQFYSVIVWKDIKSPQNLFSHVSLPDNESWCQMLNVVLLKMEAVAHISQICWHIWIVNYYRASLLENIPQMLTKRA
jgi:hypothetical protein